MRLLDLRRIGRSTSLSLVTTLCLWALASPVPAVTEGTSGTFTDDDGNVHEGAIEAMAGQGITVGCSASETLYCPLAPVTRGQVATFLAKAAELPPASGIDHFSDDDGTIHEDNINRVADAKIAEGDGRGSYGPGEVVTRGQLASFLVKALDLQAPVGDRFSDDGGTADETSINALADADATDGCGEGRYCPQAPARRDQTATFLWRVLRLR